MTIDGYSTNSSLCDEQFILSNLVPRKYRLAKRLPRGFKVVKEDEEQIVEIALCARTQSDGV